MSIKIGDRTLEPCRTFLGSEWEVWLSVSDRTQPCGVLCRRVSLEIYVRSELRAGRRMSGGHRVVCWLISHEVFRWTP